MKPFQPSACIAALSLIGAALLVSACASKSASVAPSQSAGEQKIVLREGEYKEVYVTGSNIPVRVSASPTARPLPGATNVTTLSPDEWQDLMRRGDALGGRR